MLNALRRKFTLLYTFSTGMILTIVLIFVMINTNEQLLKSKKDSFLNNFILVSRSVEMDREVSHLWMSELEIKNHLIIHIEDNGEPLEYKGAWITPTTRNILVDRLKSAAGKDNIDTTISPVSLKELQSKTYMITGENKDRYFGAVFMVPYGDGYRSLSMLQYINDNRGSQIGRILFMLGIDIGGIGALFLISRWIVGKSLKPVEESRRQQTEFIAAASHELKSPLAVIRANASAIKIEPDRSDYYVEGIDKECVRMSGLIEDLLLLAATDANRWKIKKGKVDIDALLIETYDLYHLFCKENKKNLKLELKEDLLPEIEGDKERLKQILGILIDNAVTYTKDGDTIILRGYVKKNNLILEVEDHGVGIADDRKKEVFGRFYRGDQSRKDKNHYGLGLSIGKELAELHGGIISLRDTLGGGATFTVSIPMEKS